MVSVAVSGLSSILTIRIRDHAVSGETSQLQTWLSAFNDTFLVVLAVAFAGTLLSLTLRKPKEVPKPAVDPSV